MLQIGQEVRIKNTNYVFGKIDGSVGDQYIVEVEPCKLRLRASDIELLEEPQSKEEELISVQTERWLAFSTAASLLEEWGGNLDTDPIPEEIWNQLRKAFSVK